MTVLLIISKESYSLMNELKFWLDMQFALRIFSCIFRFSYVHHFSSVKVYSWFYINGLLCSCFMFSLKLNIFVRITYIKSVILKSNYRIRIFKPNNLCIDGAALKVIAFQNQFVVAHSRAWRTSGKRTISRTKACLDQRLITL